MYSSIASVKWPHDDGDSYYHDHCYSIFGVFVMVIVASDIIMMMTSSFMIVSVSVRLLLPMVTRRI